MVVIVALPLNSTYKPSLHCPLIKKLFALFTKEPEEIVGGSSTVIFPPLELDDELDPVSPPPDDELDVAEFGGGDDFFEGSDFESPLSHAVRVRLNIVMTTTRILYVLKFRIEILLIASPKYVQVIDV